MPFWWFVVVVTDAVVRQWCLVLAWLVVGLGRNWRGCVPCGTRALYIKKRNRGVAKNMGGGVMGAKRVVRAPPVLRSVP